MEERLDEFRLAHSYSVADCAKNLARIYGLDQMDAYTAGLLHDWDKNISPELLFERARKYGIVIPEDRGAALSLLHAQTGAAALADEFPELDEAIITAISRHTLAAADMSDLDMVVYVADMIEPLRSKAALDDIRFNVGDVSLPELFHQCYALSIRSLIDKHRYIYPGAVSVWNTLVKGTTK